MEDRKVFSFEKLDAYVYARALVRSVSDAEVFPSRRTVCIV